MNTQRIHQSRRKQICSERLQLPTDPPKPEKSDEELDRLALQMLEEKPKVKGAGQ